MTMLKRVLKSAMTASLAAFPGAAFAATDTALLPRNLSPWKMFLDADIVVQAVMVGLAIASLVTWTIWLAKTLEIRRKTALAKRRIGLLEADTVLADVEKLSDVGMVQRRNRFGFDVEAGPQVGTILPAIGDDLDRHGTPEARVDRAVHLAHAAVTYPGDDFVRPELRPSSERHGLSSRGVGGL